MLIQYFNLNFVETPYQPSPFSSLLFFPCSRVVSEPWVWRDRHSDPQLSSGRKLLVFGNFETKHFLLNINFVPNNNALTLTARGATLDVRIWRL